MVKPLRSFFFCVCVLFGRLLNVYFFSLSTPSLWSSPSTSFCVAIGEKSLGGWTQELLFFSFCAMMIPFPVSQSDRESGALDLNNKIGADPKWPSSLRLYRPLDRIASFITCHWYWPQPLCVYTTLEATNGTDFEWRNQISLLLIDSLKLIVVKKDSNKKGFSQTRIENNKKKKEPDLPIKESKKKSLMKLKFNPLSTSKNSAKADQ